MAGVKGRSGRKPALLKLLLDDLLNRSWPLDDRRAVISSLHTCAMGGDVEAAKVLLSYAYGKPNQRHEISGPGGEALEVELNVSDQLKRKLANLARARGAE